MDSSADKEGLQSGGRKDQSTRHGPEPTPETAPVPGAFGREGIDRETDDRLDVPSRLEDDAALDDDAIDLDLDDDDDTLMFEEDAGDEEPGV